ncbi:hypothetical protein [Oceanirhabdus sp. W0125-5]|uniref:hypothetical protein n=1 Tax=Oceanirhabdus sp. W0125-5 TaxID=2999116 RepID=UPI0022F2D9B5|nr:hypothetical protein [Oceanirhabdus sp. W0125-5]WBW98923.1 hypothetical protein OW730_09315 [Oceanirhabdus sp. W0125-5]
MSRYRRDRRAYRRLARRGYLWGPWYGNLWWPGYVNPYYYTYPYYTYPYYAYPWRPRYGWYY